MKTNFNLKKIDKKITAIKRLEKVFVILSNYIHPLKSLAASVVTMFVLAFGNSFNHILSISFCGALWFDFMLEATTSYGENICDGILDKISSKKNELNKIKSNYQDNVKTVSKKEILANQKELYGFADQEKISIINYSPKEDFESSGEKNC